MNPDMKRLCDCFADPGLNVFGALTDEEREAIVRAVLTELREVGYKAASEVAVEIGDPDNPLATGIQLSDSEVGDAFLAVLDAIFAEPATA